MCDTCSKGLKDDVIRGVFYGILKKFLDYSPVGDVVNTVDKTVEGIIDGGSAIGSARKDMDTMKKAGLYILASWAYENWIYAYVKNMESRYASDKFGLCACEVMRDLYLILILQLYSSYMHGFKLKTLITDAAAVFGADYIDKMAQQFPIFGGQKKLIASAPAQGISVPTQIKDAQELVTTKSLL